MQFFKKNWPIITVILIACLFFIVTAGFNYLVHQEDYVKWSSPDETANYFFIKNYTSNQTLAVFEPANLIAEEVVRPRSMRSDHGWLKPVSFLGIIVFYGELASWLGTAAIPYFTPFLAALGIIFFYLFVRNLFNQRIGVISAALLASFPVYIYYSVRSLFHNVLFLVFLIIVAYFLQLSLQSKYSLKEKFFKLRLRANTWLGFLWPFLAGLALGGAVATRTSEIIWLGPTLFLAWLFYARRLGLRIFLILAGAGFAFLPVAYFNQLLYDFPLFGGYSEMNTSLQQISQAGSTFVSSALFGKFEKLDQFWTVLRDNIFYFGYQPIQSLKMFYYYFLVMFPYLSLATALGIITFLIGWWRKVSRWRLVYLLSWFTLACILVIYYGSWQFFDNPDPSRYTIGNSYTRYWLPIYLLAIPLASLAIFSLSRLLSGSFGRPSLLGRYDRARIFLSNGLQLLVVMALVFNSLLFVFFGSEEGLAHLYYNHFQDKDNIQRVLAATEDGSIIVTQYHDKQLFPERRVVVALLNHETTNQSLGKIMHNYPVYYYNFAFPETDLNYLNERRLPTAGFNIELILRQGRFGLYRLIPVTVEPNEDLN